MCLASFQELPTNIWSSHLSLVNQAPPSVTKWVDFERGRDIIDLRVNSAERYQTTPLLYKYIYRNLTTLFLAEII
jgi:hypothetical protein